MDKKTVSILFSIFALILFSGFVLSYCPDGSGNWEITGTYNLNQSVDCSNITIIGTLTINSRQAGNVSINITADNLNISSAGKINLDGTGFKGGAVTAENGKGPGGGNGGASGHNAGGGAGHASPGADGYYSDGPSITAYGGISYGSYSQPIQPGSGGGSGGDDAADGGSGGGAVFFNVSNLLTNNGLISANGNNGVAGANYKAGGGGSGGSIYIITNQITGNGNITANGGKGAVKLTRYGGCGSGGRIAVYYNTNNFNGLLEAKGCTNYDISGPGTIYLKDNADAYGSLTLDNKGNVNPTKTAFDGTFNFKNLEILGGAILQHSDNSNTQQYSMIIHSGNITLDAISSINLNLKGYTGGTSMNDGYGPGKGKGSTNSGNYAGGGAGHGGDGGDGYNPGYSGHGEGGNSYSSIISPLEIGSGGGGSGESPAGADGGGAVFLNASGTLIINGTITANGGNGQGASNAAGGGGSGGSIFLKGYNIKGNGTLSANGGTGGTSSPTYGGRGAGGRISIHTGPAGLFDSDISISKVGQSCSYSACTSQNGTLFLCIGTENVNCPGSGSGINLNTNFSKTSFLEITREIISWSSSLMKWNDSSTDSSNIAGYIITGLQAATQYNIYNNGVNFINLTTDGSGNLPKFNVTLSSEHEIIVQQEGGEPPEGNYTVIVGSSYLADFNITANETTGEIGLIAGAHNITSGIVLVRRKINNQLIARYTLKESVDLNLTDANYQYGEANFSGVIANVTIDDSDYTKMIKKEAIFPGTTTSVSICNEKGKVYFSTACSLNNIFNFDETEINAGTSKVSNGKNISIAKIGSYVSAWGELDQGAGEDAGGGYQPEGEGGTEVPEFSSIFSMILFIAIALAVFALIKKKKAQ
jgi:hypothetical protein